MSCLAQCAVRCESRPHVAQSWAQKGQTSRLPGSSCFSQPRSHQTAPQRVAVRFGAKFSRGLGNLIHLCGSLSSLFLSSPLAGVSKARSSQTPRVRRGSQPEVLGVWKWKSFFIAQAGPNFTFRVSASKTDRAIRGLSLSNLSFKPSRGMAEARDSYSSMPDLQFMAILSQSNWVGPASLCSSQILDVNVTPFTWF